ncbi:MAG: hypothetical protein H0W53_00110 [Acidobacteria bacterium]|nr:hypothetical protein [Acidobacteriota bacterium]
MRLAEGDVAAAASAFHNVGIDDPRSSPPAVFALIPSTWDKGPSNPGMACWMWSQRPVDPSVLFAKLAAVRT